MEVCIGFSQCLWCFFEGGIGVGVEYFGLFVVVVIRGVIVCKDVVELVWEVILGWWVVYCYFCVYVVEQCQYVVLC